MTVIELANAIQDCKLSEGRRALVRLKAIATSILAEENKMKIEKAKKPIMPKPGNMQPCVTERIK